MSGQTTHPLPSPSGTSPAAIASARNAGFALVVTVSLMVLLTVLAVGMLTLSSLSLRTSAQSADMNLARANARMALLLALGELQKNAGSDTRVTPILQHGPVTSWENLIDYANSNYHALTARDLLNNRPPLSRSHALDYTIPA